MPLFMVCCEQLQWTRHTIIANHRCFNKFSFHPKWNEACLLAINMVYASCSRVAERLNQRLSQNADFFNTSKNLLKNRNWTFPGVRYLTRKLEFVSNILCAIVSEKCFCFWLALDPFKIDLFDNIGNSKAFNADLTYAKKC